MAKVVMGIGLAGAGKTTALKAFANRYGYGYFNTDDMRAEYSIPRGEATPIAVWDEMRKRIRESISKSETIVIDSTFVTGPDRRTFIEFLRSCGAEKIQGVFLDTPSDLAWQRNMERDRYMSRDVFDSRLQDLNADPPSTKDGFDTLFTLNEFQKLMGTERPEQRRELKGLL